MYPIIQSKIAQLSLVSLGGWGGHPISPITQLDASQHRHLLADVTEMVGGAFLRGENGEKKPKENLHEHLRNHIPNWPQITSVFMIPTLERDQGQNGVHGKVAKWKTLLTKKNIKAQLTFAKNDPSLVK